MSDIQATTTQESSILQKVQVEIAADRVGKAFEKAYKDLAKSSHLKGFRRGKAPRSVLQRVYGPQVAEQLEQTLIQETLSDALEQAGVEPVAPPAVDSSAPAQGESFSYTAHVEVKPSIELPELEGLPAQRPAAEVEEEEVDNELENLRERNAPVVEEPEGTEAETGHTLSVDFVGKIDGEVFEGGTGRDVQIEIGAGRFIPGFEDQLVGATADSDVEVTTTFPDDYPAEQLAGKEAVFAVHVAEVKKKQLPALDDEFAKDVSNDSASFDTLAELRDRIRSDLLEMKERNAKSALHRSLLEALVERTEFDVPHGLVDQQLQRRLESMHRQMQGAMEHEELQQELDRMREQWRPVAEREVREQLLIEAVANVRDLEASEDEVEARVEQLAAEQGVDAATMRSAVGEGVAEAVAKGQVRDEKALDFLAAAAKVEEISDS